MSDELEVDATLAALCESLRERDAAWDELSEGARDVAEIVVERRAAGDDEATLERARALYEPMSEQNRESLLALLGPEQGEAAAPLERGKSDAQASRSCAGGGLGLWLALAAAAVLLVLALRPALTPDTRPQVARALPSFTLSTDSGGASSRGEVAREGQTLRYVAANRFDWLLRPAEAVEGPLELGVCAQGEQGAARIISAASLVEVAPSGSLRLHGSVAALGLERGRWSLVLGVRAETGAGFEVDLCRAQDSARLRVRRVELRVD